MIVRISGARLDWPSKPLILKWNHERKEREIARDTLKMKVSGFIVMDEGSKNRGPSPKLQNRIISGSVSR